MSIRASSLLLLENCLFLPCLADRKWGRASFKRRYAEADWYQRYDSELSSQLKIKSDDSILAVIVIVIKHYFYRSDRKAHASIHLFAQIHFYSCSVPSFLSSIPVPRTSSTTEPKIVQSLFLNFILPLPAWRTPPLESLSGQRGGMKSLIAAGQERVWDARRGWMLGNNKNGPRATRSQCGAAAIRVMKVWLMMEPTRVISSTRRGATRRIGSSLDKILSPVP